MKEYPILCDKIECYKKERGCNPMKKDRLIVLTDAVLAIIMTILVGIVMDGTKHIMGKG